MNEFEVWSLGATARKLDQQLSTFLEEFVLLKAQVEILSARYEHLYQEYTVAMRREEANRALYEIAMD